jgi:LAO/AO transport system kinase
LRNLEDLVARFFAGDPLALARTISRIENRDPEARLIFDRVYPRAGNGIRIGITGPPGAGKSTLVTRIALALRKEGVRVGIIAVDPTSPFTGGALLGDRIRMNDLLGEPGIFVRSMATRGSLGGLSDATLEAAEAMAAFGMDRILIETVGVGQSELDVAETADTTVVVLVPESGDVVQTMKAGLMEIGDVFVVNKADRDGADRLAAELRSTLDLAPGGGGWRPPVVKTMGLDGTGVPDLVRAIGEHAAHARRTGRFEEHREKLARTRIQRSAESALLRGIHADGALRRFRERLVRRVRRGDLSPYAAGEELSAAIARSLAGTGGVREPARDGGRDR